MLGSDLRRGGPRRLTGVLPFATCRAAGAEMPRLRPQIIPIGAELDPLMRIVRGGIDQLGELRAVADRRVHLLGRDLAVPQGILQGLIMLLGPDPEIDDGRVAGPHVEQHGLDQITRGVADPAMFRPRLDRRCIDLVLELLAKTVRLCFGLSSAACICGGSSSIFSSRWTIVRKYVSGTRSQSMASAR